MRWKIEIRELNSLSCSSSPIWGVSEKSKSHPPSCFLQRLRKLFLINPIKKSGLLLVLAPRGLFPHSQANDREEPNSHDPCVPTADFRKRLSVARVALIPHGAFQGDFNQWAWSTSHTRFDMSPDHIELDMEGPSRSSHPTHSL